MGLGTVKAFAKFVNAILTPQTTVTSVPDADPAAGAFVEFEAHFAIGSLTAELSLPITTATGISAPGEDVCVEILTQYFAGAVYDPSADEYTGGSWIDLIPRMQLNYSGTAGTKAGRVDLNWESPIRPPIDLHQSLLTQVRDATNNAITNQKKRHFISPNTHRHTYSGGITGDASAAGKAWDGHFDFRIWARHMVAPTSGITHAVGVQVGLV